MPQQDNNYDCGLFVCKYAFGLYQLRNKCFYTKNDIANNYSAITESKFFQFNKEDIVQLRLDLIKLFEGLNAMYKARCVALKPKRGCKKKKSDVVLLVKISTEHCITDGQNNSHVLVTKLVQSVKPSALKQKLRKRKNLKQRKVKHRSKHYIEKYKQNASDEDMIDMHVVIHIDANEDTKSIDNNNNSMCNNNHCNTVTATDKMHNIIESTIVDV